MQKNNDLAASENDGPAADRLAAFQKYRGLLFSIAYRMLGSVADAEDMLQETFIRWQQAAGGDIQSPRAFLVTIISRLCINHLQSARVRREEHVGQWLPEPLISGPDGDPVCGERSSMFLISVRGSKLPRMNEMICSVAFCKRLSAAT
jgi:RNA polymerase sigma-70 factor (ECF subfamily)